MGASTDPAWLFGFFNDPELELLDWQRRLLIDLATAKRQRRLYMHMPRRQVRFSPAVMAAIHKAGLVAHERDGYITVDRLLDDAEIGEFGPFPSKVSTSESAPTAKEETLEVTAQELDAGVDETVSNITKWTRELRGVTLPEGEADDR